MKLNCRPGDLAVIIASDPYTNPDTGGVLCDVLHHPPGHPFQLPCGTPANTQTDPDLLWVIHLHRPITTRWSDGKPRLASYAVCPDAKLRPIRPQSDGAADETLTWVGHPSREVA